MWEGGDPPYVPAVLALVSVQLLGCVSSCRDVCPAAGTCVRLDFVLERGAGTGLGAPRCRWDRGGCSVAVPRSAICPGQRDVGGFGASPPTRPEPAAAGAQVVLAKPRSRSWLLSSSLLWQAEESDKLLRR